MASMDSGDYRDWQTVPCYEQNDEQRTANVELIQALQLTPNGVFGLLRTLGTHGECILADAEGNPLAQVTLAEGERDEA